MDQELKQRLIGAAVITALAAIFVPMLFDDPVDEKGKNINALTIPEMPAKLQDVDIAPLPEKVEDVTAKPGIQKNSHMQHEEDESEDVAGLKPKPKLLLSSKETAIDHSKLKVIEPDVDALAEDEDLTSAPEPNKNAVKLNKAPVQPPAEVNPGAVSKPIKPVTKIGDNPLVESSGKVADPAVSEAGTRWYLNAGSFSQKANAIALQDTLKQQGFAATVKEVTNDKGSVFKVRVGPMLDKAKAQVVKNKLTQININSFVSPDE